jgi:hypothetical protein
MPSLSLHIGYGNMFSFDSNSNNKDKEGVAIADRIFMEVDLRRGL